jgi:hypothetical protein
LNIAEGNCLIKAKISNRFIVAEHFVEEGTQGLHFARLDKLTDAPLTQQEATEAKHLMVKLIHLMSFLNH